MEQPRKPRVLLVAFQCAPQGGSVAMIGHRWLRYLHPHADLHLVTHVRHRAELAHDLPEGVTATFVDTEWFSRPLFLFADRVFRGAQHLVFMLSNLDFLLFSHKALRLVRPLHRTRPFDVVHLVTPVTPMAPHRLGRLGPPTVLGPLNGGLPMMQGFPEIGRAERAWTYRIRGAARLLARLTGTMRDAALILSASRAGDGEVPPRYAAKLRRCCENGVEEVADTVPPFPPPAPLRLVFVGRLIPVKGLGMLLDALARVPGVALTVVGSGPLDGPLRAQTERLGLTDRVHFVGQVTTDRLPELYRAAHLNVLPSVRESGGATILEAMAQGRPSLALDQGGPAEYITPETGFLLPCRHTVQVTDDLARTLAELRDDPFRLTAMGAACLEHVRTRYTWSAKIEETLGYYRLLTAPEAP